MSEFLDLHDDASARRVLFVSAVLLILFPFLQAGSQIWPLQFGNIQWRYGAANAFSAVLLLPYLGLVLLALLARGLGSRGLGRTVGVCSMLFTMGLVGSLVVFVLDALQLRTIVSTAMTASFNSTSIRVGLVTVTFAVAFGHLTAMSFRAPRSGRPATVRKGAKARARESEADLGLIVGLREG